jgi:hypothetical protein
MNELVSLVRAYVARTDGGSSSSKGRGGNLGGSAGGGGGGNLVAAGNLNLSFSRSSFMVPMCALCGNDPVCPFLDAADRTSGAGSAPSPDRRHGSGALVRISELCYQCFRTAYKAIVRPLLADELHRCRLATLLEEMATATADSDAAAEAAARRLQPLSEGARWACHRCTFAGNPASRNSCEVCGGPSPSESQCTECKQNMTAALIGRPCKAALARRVSQQAAGSRGLRAPSTRPPPKDDVIALLLGEPTPRRRSPPPGTAALPAPVHCMWACERCTLINTVDLDVCVACDAPRGWECPRCTAVNTSLRAPNGERGCSICGHISIEGLSAASDRHGIDPRDVIRERKQQQDSVAGNKRLDERLRTLGLVRSIQAGDGNCQFRALAHQLFGNPSLHMYVRNCIATHMLRRARSELEVLFADKSEFESYVASMSQSGTWGDELSLRCAADALGCHVHVISTAQQNWHLHFAPRARHHHDLDGSSTALLLSNTNASMTMGPAPALDATIMHPVRVAVAALQKELLAPGESRTEELQRQRSQETATAAASPLLETTRNMSAEWPLDAEDGFPHVFLAYESPVHYDDVAVVGADGKPRALGRHTVDMCRTIAAVVDAIVREEKDWVDAGSSGGGGLAARLAACESITPQDALMATTRATSDWVDVEHDDGPSRADGADVSEHDIAQAISAVTRSSDTSAPASRQHTEQPGETPAAPMKLRLNVQ